MKDNNDNQTPCPGKPEHIIGPLEQIERAQIDMQIATAKRYPRDVAKVKAEILAVATLDEETAAACFYTLPRGGKSIRGPSVRLAEIAVSCYGNIRAGSRVLDTVLDGPAPHVVVQAVAHDLEKNIAVTLEKRRRILKKRSKAEIDEDDINLAYNACAAIAFRDAVYKVVPLVLVKPAYEAAMKMAVGELKSLVAKRGKVVDRLKQMGIEEDRILAACECKSIEDIGADELALLIGLGTALKEGETTVEQAFPAVVKKPLFGAKPEPQVADDNTELKSTDKADQPGEPQNEGGPGTQPKGPATAEAPPAQPMGQWQEQLTQLVIKAGHSFDDFREAVMDTFPDADSWPWFDAVPKGLAGKFVSSSKSLLDAIAKAKAKAKG